MTITDIQAAMRRAARDADMAPTSVQYSMAMSRWWDAKWMLRDAQAASPERPTP